MNNKKYIDHLITSRTITVVFDIGEPISLTKSDDNTARFNHIVKLIKTKKFDEVPNAIDKTIEIETTTKGKFTVQDGSIVIDGCALPGALSDKLLEMIDARENTSYLENFWDNLSENPTDSARSDLYSFLTHNNVPITADGCFIVYKKVRDNYWDSHTGKTHQNKPGMVVKMDREAVDKDRNRTCSAGLHVAAYEYAQGFTGQRLLECKVNPADVVAVPPDYNNQKMRVCRYEVLRETDKKYVEGTYEEAKPTVKLDAGKFKPLRLRLDARGRLRIPGKAVRRLGTGVGYTVEAVITSPSSRFIKLVSLNNDKSYASSIYTIDKDNAIRISDAFLAKAKLNGYSEYTVRLKGDSLEIRA